MPTKSARIDFPPFLAPALLILSLGLLIYSNSFRGEFCSDDERLIVTNPAIKDIGNIGPIWNAFNTRFLAGLSFAVNYWLGGLNPLGYHVLNFSFHITAAYLVFCLVWMTWQTPVLQTAPWPQYRQFVAYAAALIFLVHPVQVQGVTYITQRFVSMATICYLAALIFYVTARLKEDVRYLWAGLLSMGMGVFVKEMMVTLPLMLIVYEKFFFPVAQDRKELIRKIKYLSGFFAMAALIPFIFMQDQETSILSIRAQVQLIFDWNYFLTEINVLRTYLRMFILPFGLSHSYDYPVAQGLGEWMTVYSIGLLGGLMTAAVYLFQRQRLISFAIVWFLITTSVEALHVCFVRGGKIYDHWLYLPMVGFAICVPVVLCVAVREYKKMIPVLGCIVIIFSVLTFQRNQVWQTCAGMWEDVIKKSPNDILPYNNLAVMYSRRGDFAKAILYYNQALGLPRVTHSQMIAQIYTNLSAVYGRQGDFAREFATAQKALTLDPGNAQAYSNSGMALVGLGDVQSALSYLQQAAALAPRDAGVQNNLGMLYAQQGFYDTAAVYFETAIKISPENREATTNLGLARQYLKGRAHE